MLRFFVVALGGVSLDFGLFSLLVAADVPLFTANITSSTSALLVVYHMSMRSVFNSSEYRARLWLFFLWYSFSISLFSIVITWIHEDFEVAELLSKLLVMGPSFITNFFAVRIVSGALMTSRPRQHKSGSPKLTRLLWFTKD